MRELDNLIDAVDKRIEQSSREWVTEGTVVSIGTTAVVKLTGGNVQEALIADGVTLKLGKKCILARPARNAKWIALGSYSKPLVGGIVSTNPDPAIELAPPTNLVAIDDVIAAVLIVVWDCPAQQPVVFEVQTSADGLEEPDEDATYFLTTRGSYALVPSEDEIFVRVRSIAGNFRKSAWSDWVSGTPAPAATEFSLTVAEVDTTPTVVDVDTIIFDGATVTDNMDGSVTVEITASFTGDASDVPYTPADGTDWGTDPDDVAEGLDQLALRLTDIEAGEPDAPTDATYITQTPSGGLSAEQALSVLATGILKSTTATGVVSIAAAGTDYTSPTGTEGLSNKTITASSLIATALSLLIGGFKAIFTHTNSADRTYTLPNYDGTLATLAGSETLTNKTLTAPTIADFTNAQHDHLDADDGGTLSAAAITSGTFDHARVRTNSLTFIGY